MRASTSYGTTRPVISSANVSGYFTKDFGATQVERQYGDVLVGSTAKQQVRAR